MNFSLPYHQKKIEVSFSPKNLAYVIMPQKMNPIPDVPQAITIALDDPRDQDSFDRFAQRGGVAMTKKDYETWFKKVGI